MNSRNKGILYKLSSYGISLSLLKLSCLSIFLLCIFSCKSKRKQSLKDKEIVADVRSLNIHVGKQIEHALSIAVDNNGKVHDSMKLVFYKPLETYYNNKEYTPLWSDTGKFLPRVDALINYMDSSMFDGLFKADYQFEKIIQLRATLTTDSAKMKDAVLWAKADLLLTDAFMHISGDLSQGRLQPDSSCWKNDSSKYSSHFFKPLDNFFQHDTLPGILLSLQPHHKGYIDLKEGIKGFIDSMDNTNYTYLDYSFKAGEVKDSLAFIKKLQLRLSESNLIELNEKGYPDSLQLVTSIKRYQKQKKLTVDGKISTALVKMLNNTDLIKLNRIAVTLDRYKELPAKMPEKYIWVNLPAYYLQLHDSDSVVFTSKIICGKAATPTPLLKSAISDIIIFPTWTVPESIIKKEMLPALKRNPGYLARKGLNLYNFQGEKIDPSTVNWAKYSKGIPYKIQQGSGDDNALGVIKFNFENPYAVYLHDTNQRYLFKNSMRSLSHGCVRVQEWEKLAFYIIRNDSLLVQPDTLKYNTDSITSWIANKEKHRLNVKFQIPLFIRYFSCEGKEGSIKFYEDIYGDDRRLKQLYFAGK